MLLTHLLLSHPLLTHPLLTHPLLTHTLLTHPLLTYPSAITLLIRPSLITHPLITHHLYSGQSLKGIASTPGTAVGATTGPPPPGGATENGDASTNNNNLGNNTTPATTNATSTTISPPPTNEPVRDPGPWVSVYHADLCRHIGANGVQCNKSPIWGKYIVDEGGEEGEKGYECHFCKIHEPKVSTTSVDTFLFAHRVRSVRYIFLITSPLDNTTFSFHLSTHLSTHPLNPLYQPTLSIGKWLGRHLCRRYEDTTSRHTHCTGG